MSNTKHEAKGKRMRGAVSARLLFVTALAVFALAGCRQDMQDTPRYEAYEAGDVKFSQEGASSRTLVEGTVPRGYLREDSYFYTGREDGDAASADAARIRATGAAGGQAGAESSAGARQGGLSEGASMMGGGADRFPFPVTMEVLKRGQDRYNAFCAMCHGMTGEGDGMIVRRGFRKPPSFHEDRLQAGQTPVGHYFDVITNGWGAMPSYAEMVPAEDRWKIIAYVRALQLSRRAKVDDVPVSERGRLQAPPAPAGGPQQQHGGAAGQTQQGGERH